MTEPENPSTPSREEVLFQAAAALATAPRAAFLDRECAGDPALRARLEALLAAHEQTGTLFGTAAAENARHALALGPARELVEDAVGQDLGRYRLLEKLGEGGCGVVYLAEQTEGVRRRVALKVIKLGLDTREVIARFEAERQALALMDHPNIAKVLDAGVMGDGMSEGRKTKFEGRSPKSEPSASTFDLRPSTLPLPSGRPYFVMELVRGIKITDYCDRNQLSTRERLDLFIKVCQAIQHAHQKGIIHRDIKPSNILVAVQDGEPVPKVIDFGIAKAIEGRLTDATVYTRLHQFIGTPAYMSPEQAELSGLDMDTRSDIYSLGVLLYELLTGTTPFDAKELMSQGLDAMRRTIREKEPPRPSTRLRQSALAAGSPKQSRLTDHRSRITNLASLASDLDWIVMKCLEKDRARRYATANGLAADLQRHLNHEPVVARPPSATYRFQKAWRRNRLAFTGAAFLALALVGGALFSRWQTGRALEAEAVAREARADSEAVVAFLVEVFSPPDPSRDGRDVTIAETLDRAIVRLEHDFRERPGRRAVLQGAVAETYRALGLYREAIPLLEQVLHHATATHGRGHSNTVREMGRLAESYSYVGRDTEAAALLEPVLAWQRRTMGLGHSDTHRAADLLATAYEGMGRLEAALRLRHEATEEYQRTGGAMSRNVLGALRRQARLHATLGQREAATSRFEELVALSQATLGPEDRGTIWAMAELGLAYADRGMHAEALSVREDVIELSCRIFGPDHPDTLHAMHRLADSQEAIGRRPDALRLREDVVKQMRRRLGVEHKYTLQAMTSLALTHRASAGGLDAAIGLLEDVVAVRRRHQGARHRETLLAMHLLAGCYLDRGRAEDAVRQGEEVASLRREVLGPDDPETLWSIAALGEFYAEARRFREAFERLYDVLERRCQNLGGDHPDTLLAADRLSLARQLAFCERASDRGSPP